MAAKKKGKKAGKVSKPQINESNEVETQPQLSETGEVETQPQLSESISESDETVIIETKLAKTKPIKIKKSIGHEARTNRYGYIFVLPFILAFVIFNLWPTVNTFVVSFTDLNKLRNDYVFKNAMCPSCSAGLPPSAVKGRGYIGDPCKVCDGTGKVAPDPESAEYDVLGNPIRVECTVCNGLGEFRQDCHICNNTGLITPVVFNFSKLVKDTYFWGALKNTFIIWGFNFIPQLGLALILAIWLSDIRLNLVGKGLFRAIVYMPNLLTMASVAMLYRSLVDGNISPLNQFLGALGIQGSRVLPNGEVVAEAFNFFRSVPFMRGLVAFIQWWMWYGHTLIMLMAGITSIPISLYESAVVDGANSRQTSWYITIPLLRPMMLFILVTSMIGGMQMFDIPFLLTDRMGGPNNSIRTTVLYQYNIAFMGNSERGYGATVAVGVFFITIILAFIIFFFLQDRSELKKKKGGGA